MDRAEALLERIGTLYNCAPARDPLARAQYHHLVCRPLLLRGEMGAYVEHMEIVVSAFEEASDLRNAMMERSTLAEGLDLLGQVAEAEARLRQNLSDCEQLQNVQAANYARVALGKVMTNQPAKRAEARRLLEEALAFYVSIGYQRWQGLVMFYLSRLEVFEGHPEAALGLVKQASEYLDRETIYGSALQISQARALVQLGRAEEALPLARNAMRFTTKFGGMNLDDVEPVLALLEALLALGQHQEARTLVSDTLRHMHKRQAALTRPEWRASYLDRPERKKLLELSQELGVTADP
jgi:hypothetical protein